MLAGLNNLERQLVIYGVGGYSVWSLMKAVTAPKPVAHAEPAPAPVPEKKAAPVVVSKPATTPAPVLDGPNDPMVLFALQDIQARLAVIEKALKL